MSIEVEKDVESSEQTKNKKEVVKMAKAEKTRVILVNTSNRNVYVDIDGKTNTDDIIHLGPKAISTIIDLPNKSRMAEISKEYPKVIVKGV